MSDWERQVLAAKGAEDRVAEIEQELLLGTLTWETPARPDTVKYYPCTLTQTRYGGTYEGGKWVALACYPENVPKDAYGDDIPCAEWYSHPTVLLGVGETPDTAYAAMCQAVDECSHPIWSKPWRDFNGAHFGRRCEMCGIIAWADNPAVASCEHDWDKTKVLAKTKIGVRVAHRCRICAWREVWDAGIDDILDPAE